jgi:SMI1 / KNR4 family (SUKH-1)/A nuclease of the HNH/ENDO VII superfamily with conserved WHH
VVDASLPGARYALRVIHPGSPMLRVRYRQGVLVGPHGAPDWLLYARALVEVPGPVRGYRRGELRAGYVLAANVQMALDGDPLWAGVTGPVDAMTPPGWVWAHLPDRPACALVPVELHGSFRHFGGVTTRLSAVPAGGAGADGEPVELDGSGTVAPDAIEELERHFGYPLPPGYRDFLAATNGAVPVQPAVPAGGFVVDQPFFGLGRPDRLQELWYVNAWLRDRLSAGFLAIGYVQGGMLMVKLTDPDRDSVWYLDDDDPRAADADGPQRICGELLVRCADDVEAFWAGLRRPGTRLCALVDELVAGSRQAPQPLLGDALPASRRTPGQPVPRAAGTDPLVSLFELP